MYSGSNLPPYAQIAAELRDQIEKGTLAPGDRVPSTREITQRWGVAMATATKALAALRPACRCSARLACRWDQLLRRLFALALFLGCLRQVPCDL